MITLTTARNRSTRSVALLLLVLQGPAAGTVALAHASERLSAPAHIEAKHDAGCLVLHDELRCALCHYAGSQVEPEPTRTRGPDTPLSERRPRAVAAAPVVHRHRLAAPPRAPPVSRS